MNSTERLFFVINNLLNDEMSIPDLVKTYNDSIGLKNIKNCTHRDITNDIKKLIHLGFDINKKEIKKNLHLYKIDKTIFNINFDDSEKEFIKELFYDYKNNISMLSNIFEKISYLQSFSLNDILTAEIKTDINKELYIKSKKIIQKAIKERRKISFTYKPYSSNNTTSHEGFPIKIYKDEKNIERMIFLNKYNSYIEFNIDRIVVEPIISLTPYDKNIDFPPFKKAVFKLFDNAKSYHLMPNEEILSEDENSITIKTYYFSLFRLKQKLLKYGKNVEIISPEEVREELIEELKQALERYK